MDRATQHPFETAAQTARPPQVEVVGTARGRAHSHNYADRAISGIPYLILPPKRVRYAPKNRLGEQIGRRLKFRDLHVFLTVVRCRSMAKAAQQLGVSQPAVSAVIADLEHALGVRLVDRSASGVEPTPFGGALLKRSVAAFDELKQSIRDIEFLSDRTAGEVRIGAPNVLAGFVAAVIQKFTRPARRLPPAALGGLSRARRAGSRSDVHTSHRAD